MLNKEIISAAIPFLNPHDSVEFALQRMEELHCNALAVVDQEMFQGVVLEDDLLNMDEHDPIDAGHMQWAKAAVQADMHMLDALDYTAKHQLSVIPVVDPANHFIGTISLIDLMRHLANFNGVHDSGALIVLTMEKNNFSFSELSKLIETNDAQITQLNTSWDPVEEWFNVTIRLNKNEVSDVLATLQRYEYQVKYYFGEELYANELKNNYEHLMNYLKI